MSVVLTNAVGLLSVGYRGREIIHRTRGHMIKADKSTLVIPRNSAIRQQRESANSGKTIPSHTASGAARSPGKGRRAPARNSPIRLRDESWLRT
ncbi:hypothetical protein PH213_31700 [Streptomyces sp. SRF1]|uniref:hypothetical protein n=1 Tax=Streptomyces sp. SRF1 TaxID=1549642 RepID=UPI0025B0CE78|nr:hypothetical protein [Streptomyces sp. SRF1]MDN3059017.1 hypothetical protein [Streptomyces sp. SRF1]